MKKKFIAFEDIGIAESEYARWEILKNDDNYYDLLYVPEDDYSNKDIRIHVPKEDLKDLIRFMKKITV